MLLKSDTFGAGFWVDENQGRAGGRQWYRLLRIAAQELGRAATPGNARFGQAGLPAQGAMVAVPLPDAPQPLQAEITLKLDKPSGGKPEEGSEFHWRGVPTSFAQSPFLLTMEVETAKIELLKSVVCVVAPVRTGVTKK